jgi:hypothetical protein
MKQHEVIFDSHGIKLERDGQTAIIVVGDGKVTLEPSELQEVLDVLDHLERRVMSYVESQAVKKVVET